MRRFLHFVAALILVLVLPAASARAQGKTVEMAAFETVMLNCIAPMVVRDDITRVAGARGFPELPAARAAKFLKGQGGRVFAVPQAPGNIVLEAPDDGRCLVAIRQADPDRLRAVMDKIFAAGNARWALGKTEEKEGGTRKTYMADFDGKMRAITTIDDTPHDKGMQALITVFRMKEEDMPE